MIMAHCEIVIQLYAGLAQGPRNENRHGKRTQQDSVPELRNKDKLNERKTKDVPYSAGNGIVHFGMTSRVNVPKIATWLNDNFVVVHKLCFRGPGSR